MAETEDDADPLQNNSSIDTRSRSVSRQYANSTEPTKFPYYYIPKRPQVIKMRDLSPATKNRLHREYYEVYDPWTGIRIAATLGILISLFTLFLIYKGKYNRAKNNIVASKKPSLYLYDEDLDCDLGNVGSSDDTGSFAYSFRFEDDRLPREYRFGLENEDFPLEEVLVKSSVVECVALTVHKNHKGDKGPKYGTLRIKEDASRSLPCSPYKEKKKTKPPTAEEVEMQDTVAKSPYSPTPPEACSSTFGSITSFTSTDSSDELVKTTVFSKPKTKGGLSETVVAKKNKKGEVQVEPSREEAPPVATNTVVLSSKRPQDYRSRSTVVTIGRRKRKT